MKDTIAIIGAGNMGAAFYTGLHKKTRLRINVCDRNREKLDALDVEFSYTDPAAAIEGVDAVLLAVKPQSAKELLLPLSPALKDHLVISVMAGISIDALQKLTRSTTIVRAMPNLPAQVQRGITGWVATEQTNEKQRAFVRELFDCVGEEMELENEAMLDVLTPLSGSGPAYFFLLAELIAEKAQKEGFSKNDAEALARATLIGSGRLLEHDRRSPQDWRTAVTSKGGVTEAALRVMKERGIDQLFSDAVDQAIKRSRDLRQ